MCCLFGFLDPNHVLTRKQKNRLISALSAASEARGTDAAGIAYNSNGQLRVYKRPVRAGRMNFRVPEDAGVVMGHTRMATQGPARKNRNNHPFTGAAGEHPFALAHNGILYNDDDLRQSLNLPHTGIETDSYVAVQLLEQHKTLDTHNLRKMAEQVRGSFVFTVLDAHDTVYFVRGDNPLSLYRHQKSGVYVYASTKEILMSALRKTGFLCGDLVEITVDYGEILQINRHGHLARETFSPAHTDGLFSQPLHGIAFPGGHKEWFRVYVRELKSVAAAFGYSGEMIDHLLHDGFSPEEIEDWLYCGAMP